MERSIPFEPEAVCDSKQLLYSRMIKLSISGSVANTVSVGPDETEVKAGMGFQNSIQEGSIWKRACPVGYGRRSRQIQTSCSWQATLLV